MDKHINILTTSTNITAKTLEAFIEKAESFFEFPELDENNLRQTLWNTLYKLANSTTDEQLQANCFSAVRILSREKKLLDNLVESNEWLELIMKCSKLEDIKSCQYTETSKLVAIEAEKCLCNLVFNSCKVAKKCCSNGILFKLNDRISLYSDPDFPQEIKFFDVKLIFIITALCPQVRKTLREEKNAVIRLKTILYSIIQDTSKKEDSSPNILNNESASLACEVLKALFNITVHISGEDEKEIEMYNELVSILGQYLLVSIELKDKQFTLQNDVINLLTNMPDQCYKELIPLLDLDTNNIKERQIYNGHDVTVFRKILDLLTQKLEQEKTVKEQSEILSPTITVLYKAANASRIIRKYLRAEILPPLKDVHSRPEEGTALRNYLCRLLTSPMTQLRHVVAELMFVLCKMNVSRMIKYTGYGNAAGLFARRGLLGGKQDDGAAQFSSDSEDSETEEYAVNKGNINPVLGCYEAPHLDPMADMTDEEKEQEAMKLVNLINDMMKTGTIKPCRVGADGKPQPIDHVLQLQENVKNPHILSQQDSDSD